MFKMNHINIFEMHQIYMIFDDFLIYICACTRRLYVSPQYICVKTSIHDKLKYSSGKETDIYVYYVYVMQLR